MEHGLPGPAVRTPHWSLLACCIAALLMLKLVPVDWALAQSGSHASRLHHAIGTVGAMALLLGACILLRAWSRVLLLLVLPAALAVRVFYVGLLDFSGQGFTDEVFLHLEPESVAVAWMEYRWPALALLLAAAASGALAHYTARALRGARPAHGALLLVAAIAPFAWGLPALPEAQLASALSRWYFPRTLPVPEERLARWRATQLLELDLLPKHQVEATAPPAPRNLIVLFLESGGAALARHPDHPELMPTLGRLLQEQAFVPDLHASGYITIEGLVNAMCATLFPFRHGSDELAGAERLAEWMPCLGDVLRKAGYVQSYMGGAELRFAGKGAFLAAHGYERRIGIRGWREQGLHQRPRTWGLSDADLLQQSHEEIVRLRATGRPFNLTLLTIGTHLPGYSYAECAPYRGGEERFLDAVHCTDQLLARWLQRLRDDGQLRDTLVAITADHHVFPNPEMKRLFGEQAVLDRRLPLVILGTDARAVVAAGATYDLAPTLLDLLGIQHNARFALGRSLLDPTVARTVFFRKYEDIVAGVASSNGRCTTPSQGPITFPLSGCDKSELLDLLAIQHQRFSVQSSALQCAPAVGANRLLLPADPAQPFLLQFSGRDQSLRFTRSSRAVDPSTPGLYLVSFDAAGQVLERRFVPADAAAAEDIPGGDARALLAIWRGTAEQRGLAPEWLPPLPAPSHAWALSLHPEPTLVAEARLQPDHAAVLSLGPAECRALLGADVPHRP